MRVQLLSDSCTTGWAHWGHAELWLTPDAIVRVPKRSLTLAAARRGSAGGLLGGAVEVMALELSRASNTCGELHIAAEDWDGYLASYPARLQVGIGDVVSSSLRTGLITSRLSLVLVTAQRVKLLWMRNSFAIPALHSALRERLG